MSVDVAGCLLSRIMLMGGGEAGCALLSVFAEIAF